jgi:hypothetical protein
MNTNNPAPAPNDPPPPTTNPTPSPFGHLTNINFEAAERYKREFAAKMKESAKNWPKRWIAPDLPLRGSYRAKLPRHPTRHAHAQSPLAGVTSV